MNFIDKLERKFGKYSIPGLMKYVILINILGAIIGFVDGNLYYEYLSLNVDQILHGQVWRLFTFVLYSPIGQASGGAVITNLLFFAIWAYCYYNIGLTLERMWGTFRFNFFYFNGIFLVVIATFVTYFLLWNPADATANGFMGYALGGYTTLEYINEALFFAIALIFPNMQFFMYFVVPIKAKWLSIIYFILIGYDFVVYVQSGSALYYYLAALIACSFINCLVFFLFARGTGSVKKAVKQKKQKVEFRHQAKDPTGPRHRCAICGRTEMDAPQLEFRYCSKCEGNYEYCSDHLFTHEHVHH